MQLEEQPETEMVLALEIAEQENSVIITRCVLQHAHSQRVVIKSTGMVQFREIVRVRVNFAICLAAVVVCNIIIIRPKYYRITILFFRLNISAFN